MEPIHYSQPPKRKPMAEINVVPYIDVMLVLLIIFMVTAPMLVQSVSVDLPDVDTTPTEVEPDDSTIIISVDKSGQYFVERGEEQPQAMTLEAVRNYASKVVAQVPATKLLIRGDEAVPYGKVVVLMGQLQQSGIRNIGLITEAPDPEASR